MPRRKITEKRESFPDPKFNSIMVAKFVNNLMLDGKKSTAERIFYSALDMIETQTKQDGLKIFKKAVENTKPLLEV